MERMAPTISNLDKLPFYKGGNLTIDEDGELNRVFKLLDQEEQCVLKMPRFVASSEDVGNFFLEVFAVASLNEVDVSPELEIPRIIECETRPNVKPPFAAFSYINGDVLLSPDIHQNFTNSQKQEFGERVGEFVAWMAQNFSMEQYDQCLENAELDLTHVRGIDKAFEDGFVHEIAHEHGLNIFIDILEELDKEYEENIQNGKLVPRIIGHDDIRPKNLTFQNQQLTGIFDFGLAKPSTPERELRHIVHLGEEVFLPSIQRYQEATGEGIDYELALFWAKLQAAVNSTFRKANNSTEKPDEPLKISFLQNSTRSLTGKKHTQT